MFEEKEAQLKRFLDLSSRMLAALRQGNEEEVPGLIKLREECIASINKLDEKAGERLMNDSIHELLNRLQSLDQEIKPELQRVMQKLSGQVRNEQNRQFIKSQYEDWQSVPKGVFYDWRK